MLFLVTCGTYSAMPIIVCWFTMNLGGHHRRAVGSGWIIGFGNIGGIIATFAFQAQDAANFYRTGYRVSLRNSSPSKCLPTSGLHFHLLALVIFLRMESITNIYDSKSHYQEVSPFPFAGCELP